VTHGAARAVTRAGCALFALILSSSVLAACQDGGTEEPKAYRTPEVGSVRVVDASVRLPFRGYELSTADRTRMQEGQARLLQRCMAKRGFTVQIGGDYLVATRSVTGIADPFMWGGPFGTMPLEHAERFGYKPEPDGAFVKGPGFYLGNPVNLFLSSELKVGVDPAAERAYYGTSYDPEDGSAEGGDPETGCSRKVESAIGVPLVNTIDLEADLGNLTREHQKVEAATRDWVECMGRRGYQFKHFWEASQEFLLPPVSKRQIKVAVDDVECTSESGWPNYYYAVLADYERQAIKKDPGLLEAGLASEKARLAAIERELARDE
jgi:hypothetical protein